MAYDAALLLGRQGIAMIRKASRQRNCYVRLMCNTEENNYRVTLHENWPMSRFVAHAHYTAVVEEGGGAERMNEALQTIQDCGLLYFGE